jgi:hypothetical protein
MVAHKDIQPGEEILSDYSKHNIEDLETPEDFKKGGSTRKPQIPKGKSPKSYSRSFEATNRLFAQNPLFKKPKSRKNKIFDPNAKYYQDGGFTVDLTEDEIKQYVDGGYIVEDISVPALNTFDKGGTGCPPGHYYNGKECVKIPKGAKVIKDPKEYEKRKAAYYDSLTLYKLNTDYLKADRAHEYDQWKIIDLANKNKISEKEYRDRLLKTAKQAYELYSKFYDYVDTRDTKIKNEPKEKTYSLSNNKYNYNTNSDEGKLIKGDGKLSSNNLYRISDTKYSKPKQPVVLSKPYLKVKENHEYPTGYDEPIVTSLPPGKTQVGTQEIQNLDPKTGRVTTVIEPVYEDEPMPEKLPLLQPTLIDTSKDELQGEYQEDLPPQYQMPGYNVERSGIYMRHGNRPTLVNVRRPGIVSKALQKFTGYNPEYSEGYVGEDGYVPGEFENAETQNRRINFQGASSLQDLKAQKEYNKAYDEYEAKQKFAKAMAATYGLKKYGGEPVPSLTKARFGRISKSGSKESNTFKAPTLKDVQFRPAEIQSFNPQTKQYEIHTIDLPDRIVPGREYADVKHKLPSLRKDLNISGIDHAMNKYIPGAAHPIGMARDSGIVIDPTTGQLFDSNTRYWLNREYGFEPNIGELLEPMSSRIARDYGTFKMSSDTAFENKKMGINYMDELANPYTQKGNGLKDLFNQPVGGPLMIGMGMMGEPKFTKEIKNPDYFTQLLDTFDSKKLSASNKKYYKDLINSVKKQNGLATDRQFNELQRLKTGNFDFGSKGYNKGYADGGEIDYELGQEVDELTKKKLEELGYTFEIVK